MNSYIGLALVYTGGMIIFGIWNLKGYFDNISISIDEAAKIDGASYLYILLRIIIPLGRPAIIVTGILIFITTWNEYIYAVTFLTDRNSYTLAAGLYSLQGTEHTTNWPVFTAGAILVTIPVLIVFFIVQRFMASGLTAGGVKY
jgi:ABC-type maltose transport system permease subunit